MMESCAALRGLGSKLLKQRWRQSFSMYLKLNVVMPSTPSMLQYYTLHTNEVTSRKFLLLRMRVWKLDNATAEA